MKKDEEERLKNMARWTKQDYMFYAEFQKDLFTDDKSKDASIFPGVRGTTEEDWLRFKEWLKTQIGKLPN